MILLSAWVVRNPPVSPPVRGIGRKPPDKGRAHPHPVAIVAGKMNLPSVETKFAADDRDLRSTLDRSAPASKAQEAQIGLTGHALRGYNEGISVLSTTPPPHGRG